MAKAKTAENDKDNSSGLSEAWLEIRKSQKVLTGWMIGLFLTGVVFLIVTLVVVHPTASTVISGYGDVYQDIAGLSRGYRWESWWNMLAFPVLALILGILHNIIAVKIYQKYGKDLAIIFVATSLLIMLVATMTMLRVIGEW